MRSKFNKIYIPEFLCGMEAYYQILPFLSKKFKNQGDFFKPPYNFSVYDINNSLKFGGVALAKLFAPHRANLAVYLDLALLNDDFCVTAGLHGIIHLEESIKPYKFGINFFDNLLFFCNFNFNFHFSASREE